MAKKIDVERRMLFDMYVDPFYSESNIKYLENVACDIKEGKAHFAEHDLIDGNELCNYVTLGGQRVGGNVGDSEGKSKCI
jgi:hypothetical protein